MKTQITTKKEQQQSATLLFLFWVCSVFISIFWPKTSCSLILEGIKLYSPSDSSLTWQMGTGYHLTPQPRSGFCSCKRVLTPLCVCLSNKLIVYQLCSEQVKCPGLFSFSMPIPASSGWWCVHQESEASCCFPTEKESRLPALGSLRVWELLCISQELQVKFLLLGRSRAGAPWAMNTVSSLKASLLPDHSWVQEKE